MVAYSQTILFAHKLRSSSAFLPKSTLPLILSLRKALELPCETTIETGIDSYYSGSDHPCHYSSPQDKWEDSSNDPLISIHHMIPNEQDFQDVLTLNAGTFLDLSVNVLHWSEAEILYLRHRALN
jgi:hypothetical protein